MSSIKSSDFQLLRSQSPALPQGGQQGQVLPVRWGQIRRGKAQSRQIGLGAEQGEGGAGVSILRFCSGLEQEGRLGPEKSPRVHGTQPRG